MNESVALLIDGNAVLCNSYYATRYDNKESDVVRTVNGSPSNGIYLFVQNVLKMIRVVKPTHFFISWDADNCFRKEDYPDYKGKRSPKPADLVEQLNSAPQFVKELGWKQGRIPRLEGDDVLATMVEVFKRDGIDKIYVVTGDRDLFQLADEKVSILYYTSTYRDILNKYDLPAEYMFPCSVLMDLHSIPLYVNVQPYQISAWKGLAGDTSDNFPGVKGVTEESAAKLLLHYGNLDNLFNDLESNEESCKEFLKGISKVLFTSFKKEDAKKNAYFFEKLASCRVANISKINSESYRLNLKKDVLADCFTRWKFFKLLEIFKLSGVTTNSEHQENIDKALQTAACAVENPNECNSSQQDNSSQQNSNDSQPDSNQSSENQKNAEESNSANANTPKPDNKESDLGATFPLSPTEEEDIRLFYELVERIALRYTKKPVSVGQTSKTLGTVQSISLELKKVLGNNLVNVVLHTDRGIDYPIIK